MLLDESNQSASAEAHQAMAEQRINFTLNTPEEHAHSVWRASEHSNFSVPESRIPEIDVEQLSLDHVGNGVHHHGALIVRNFFSAERAAQYRHTLDVAFDEQDSFDENPQAERKWFNPPEGLLNHPGCQRRGMVRSTGSMWALNSPRIMHHLLDDYEQLGLKDLCRNYFGQEPLLSVKKWVLRRIQPLAQPSDWHQDGAFMGPDVLSLNLWIALTECGANTSSPGLDIMPGRLKHIVDTGTHGAAFPWSVGEQAASDSVDGQAPLEPHFNAGDAVFFDHFNLHRTSFSPTFETPRYAIECWFLGASNYPEKQIPLRW